MKIYGVGLHYKYTSKSGHARRIYAKQAEMDEKKKAESLKRRRKQTEKVKRVVEGSRQPLYHLKLNLQRARRRCRGGIKLLLVPSFENPFAGSDLNER